MVLLPFDMPTIFSGLDASVGLETDRPENSGLFINDTLRFFSPVFPISLLIHSLLTHFQTVTAYLSMSDNIALVISSI